MTAQFGLWPPGSSSSAVTFTAVRAALLTANLPVGFNLQSLQSVLDVNGVELDASNTGVSLRVGKTVMPASTTLARLGIGLDALGLLQPSAANVIAIGNAAGAACTTGADNVSVGHRAAELGTTGARNVAIGQEALNGNLIGAGNVAVGYRAGRVATGADNVFIGVSAAAAALGVANTVAVGRAALGSLTTGIQNTAVGQAAGGAITTQNNNTFLGNNAGQLAASAGNLVLGANADTPDAANANGLSIGNVIWGDMTLTGTGPKVRIGGTGSIAAQTALLSLVQLGDDSVPVEELTTQGANGGTVQLLCGTRDPSGAVTAPNGAVYLRKAAASSGIYINRSAGATGTSWSLVTAVP